MSQIVYDDEPCPKREPGLTHTATASGEPCTACGIAVYARKSDPRTWIFAVAPPAPDKYPAKTRTPGGIPRAFRPDYDILIRQGLTDEAAQEMICAAAGLPHGEDQKRPWFLKELAALLFMRWQVREQMVAGDHGGPSRLNPPVLEL